MRPATVALLLLIVLAGVPAMAFGAVEPTAQEWLRLAALLGFGVVAWRATPRSWLQGPAGALVLPALGLLVWAGLQLVPLPRPVLALLAPRTAHLYEATVPPDGELLPWLVQKARVQGVRVEASTPPPPVPGVRGDPTAGTTLSICPPATRQAILSWLTPLLIFLTAARIAREPLARYRLLWAIACWGGAMGLVAILQSISWNGKLLWLRPAPPDTVPLGPFVNSNHLAGYVEMGALVGLGLLLATLSRATGRLDTAALRAALADRAWALPRVIGAAALVALACAGLVLSGSRGGWISAAVGLVLLPLGRRSGGWLRLLALAVLLVGVGIGLAAWVGPTREGLQQVSIPGGPHDASTAQRIDTYGKTLRVVADSPVAGAGLGTFRWAFARHQREGEWGVWEQAHNDYLQLVCEAGLVGLALLAWALIAFAWRVLSPALRAASRGEPRWTTVASACAVFTMLVHTVVDFNLQIPGVASLFAIVLGIVTAAASDVPAPPVAEED